MPVADFRINSLVKSILVKHWVDLQKIQFDTHRGNVYLRGELSQLKRRNTGEFDRSLFDAIESEIKRIRGVRKVYCINLVIEEDANRSKNDVMLVKKEKKKKFQ